MDVVVTATYKANTAYPEAKFAHRYLFHTNQIVQSYRNAWYPVCVEPLQQLSSRFQASLATINLHAQTLRYLDLDVDATCTVDGMVLQLK